jgi:hypothetical protein
MRAPATFVSPAPYHTINSSGPTFCSPSVNTTHGVCNGPDALVPVVSKGSSANSRVSSALASTVRGSSAMRRTCRSICSTAVPGGNQIHTFVQNKPTESASSIGTPAVAMLVHPGTGAVNATSFAARGRLAAAHVVHVVEVPTKNRHLHHTALTTANMKADSNRSATLGAFP